MGRSVKERLGGGCPERKEKNKRSREGLEGTAKRYEEETRSRTGKYNEEQEGKFTTNRVEIG
jgi:hypothetical protein